MRKMKKLNKKFLVIFTVFFHSIFFAKQYNFKFHHFLPLTTGIPEKFITPWIEKIEKESQGEIVIRQFPSMQLGGTPPSLIRQVKDGTVDFIWTLPGYTPGRFPKTEAFELPFMMTTPEATSQAFYEYYEKNLKDEFQDFKIITVHTHGPGFMHSKDPIFNIDDLQGKKIRGPTRVTTKLLNALGAVPIGMPVPQVPEFLARGVIDGALLPWDVTLAIKSSELVKNHTKVFGDVGLYTATFIIAMNKKSYQRLPLRLKKVIDNNSGLKEAAWAGRVVAEEDGRGFDYAKKLGNNFITLSVTETKKWQQISDKVIQGWIDEMNKNGFDGERLVREARALIQKYSR